MTRFVGPARRPQTGARWWRSSTQPRPGGGAVASTTGIPRKRSCRRARRWTTYWPLLRQFKAGQLPTAHAVMVYREGRFASVMLGVATRTEADAYLKEATEIARNRSPHPWLRA